MMNSPNSTTNFVKSALTAALILVSIACHPEGPHLYWYGYKTTKINDRLHLKNKNKNKKSFNIRSQDYLTA